MNRRVVVHAGFHKTGTTSLQQFLYKNGKHLWPKTAMVLPFKLRETASTQSLRYSRDPDPETLDAFAADLRAILSQLDLGPNRPVIISDENLSGHIPGRHGTTGYDQCPALIERLVDVVREVLDEDADLRFVFTTRDRDSWLRSVWMHNLMRWRLTLDFDDFVASLGPMSDLDAVTRAVRDELGLAPEVRDKLTPTGIAMRGPHPALARLLLELNRSDRDDGDVRTAKLELAKPK